MKKTLHISAIILSATVLFFLMAFRQEAEAAVMKIIYSVIINRGLVGSWSFNGPDINWSTNQVTDASGNSNTGQLISMSTTTSPVLGVVGQAFNFNGSTNFVKTTNSTVFNASGTPITVTAWINDKTLAAEQCFVCKGGNGNGGWEAAVSTSKLLAIIKSGPNGTVVQRQSNSTLVANTWYFVAMIFTADTVTQSNNNILIYLNGVLDEGSLTLTNTPTITTDTVKIGVSSTNENTLAKFFTGSIDEVRIYNRALSAAEVLYLYQKSAPATASKISSDQNSELTNGLVGMWSFNGPDINWATNQATDVSGNGNTGQLISMSTTTSPTLGIVGQGLKFNGSGNFIRKASIGGSTLDISGDVTISAWLNPNTGGSGTQNSIVRAGLGSDLRYMMIYETTNQRAIFEWNDGSFKVVSGTVNSVLFGKWSHVAMVRTGTTLNIYVNGILNTSGSVTAPTTSASNFAIGSSRPDNTGSDYQGLIDEVRIYNRALSAAEIYYLYQKSAPATASKISSDQNGESTNGLVGMWSFNGPDINWATNQATDVSGNGNTGQLISMSTTTSPVEGAVGQGLKFNGVNQFASTTSGLNLSSGFTFNFWIKPATLSGDHALIGTTGVTKSQEIRIRSATVLDVALGFFTDGLNAYRNAPVNLTVNKWAMITATFDGATTVTVYQDGVTVGSKTVTSVDAVWDKNLTIGRRDPNTPEFWNGSIDEVRIYNRALSAAEVLQLYQTSKH